MRHVRKKISHLGSLTGNGVHQHTFTNTYYERTLQNSYLEIGTNDIRHYFQSSTAILHLLNLSSVSNIIARFLIAPGPHQEK